MPYTRLPLHAVQRPRVRVAAPRRPARQQQFPVHNRCTTTPIPWCRLSLPACRVHNLATRISSGTKRSVRRAAAGSGTSRVHLRLQWRPGRQRDDRGQRGGPGADARRFRGVAGHRRPLLHRPAAERHARGHRGRDAAQAAGEFCRHPGRRDAPAAAGGSARHRPCRVCAHLAARAEMRGLVLAHRPRPGEPRKHRPAALLRPLPVFGERRSARQAGAGSVPPRRRQDERRARPIASWWRIRRPGFRRPMPPAWCRSASSAAATPTRASAPN